MMRLGLTRKYASGGASRLSSAVSPMVSAALRSPGQPLDGDTRAFMESRFSHNFSQTPVHDAVLSL
jgi:hypothetical protein